MTLNGNLDAIKAWVEDEYFCHGDASLRVMKQMLAQLAAKDAEIERLRAANEWQPIEDAPDSGVLILAAHADPARQNMAIIYWQCGSVKFNIEGHWRSSTHERISVKEFTHWRPLPTPPTQGGGND